MSDKKYKIITMSDHPLAPSGVGTQARYVIEHLVKTGKFQIISLAGAMKHPDYKPQRVQEWGEDVVIIPVDGYGSKDMIRQLLDVEKPDAIWFFTDPRFYQWLWQIEDEVHLQCPMIYWHVWDNLPYPKYNEHAYKSTDFIACINRLTHKFLCDEGFEDKCEYLPHGVPEDDYKMLPLDKIRKIKAAHLSEEKADAFVVFYNSRNALRKRTGNVIHAFKEFLEMLPEKERKNCVMAMHTPPKDPEGQDLFKVVESLNIKEYVGFNDKKMPNNVMAEFYNMADATIALSSEEGFGLSILESLMCGTPVVCSKTGGMQDQVIDWETGEVFGHCIEPDASSLIGSQTTPYIWSDHVDPTTAAKCLLDLYNKKKELGSEYKYAIAGEKARESCLRRFHLPKIQERWEEIIVEQIEKFKTRSDSQVRMLEI